MKKAIVIFLALFVYAVTGNAQQNQSRGHGHGEGHGHGNKSDHHVPPPHHPPHHGHDDGDDEDNSKDVADRPNLDDRKTSEKSKGLINGVKWPEAPSSQRSRPEAKKH